MKLAIMTTVPSSSDIELQWVAPFNIYESISKYNIVIKTSGSTFLEELTYCNGDNAQIKLEHKCRVPVSTLTAAPYSLTAGNKVIA